MKLKALLIAGMVLTAGAVSSMAQGTVFSVNAVGFVNKTLNSGFQIVANPLVAATNDLNTLFPPSAGIPNLSAVYKWNPAAGSFATSFYFNGWTSNMTVLPGEGFFFKLQGSTPVTVTFVGNVNQGSLTNSLPTGFSLVSSQIPQAGGVTSLLGFPAANLDAVYQYDNVNNVYITKIFFNGSWNGGDGTEPNISVAEGFFVHVQSPSGSSWVRNFNVNQ